MGEHSRYVFGDHSHPCDSKSTGVALRGSRTNQYDCGVDITRGLVLLGVSAPRRRALLLLQINEGAPRRVHQEPATGEVPMTSSDDWRKTVRLNKLLGMWAAEKLGITGRDAEEPIQMPSLSARSILSAATYSARFVRISTLRAWSNRMSRCYAF
jgi:hypothetical protein